MCRLRWVLMWKIEALLCLRRGELRTEQARREGA
jgi:hypothetical protein